MIGPKNDAELQAALASRSCDDCRACCTEMGVDEIKKPVGETCKHLCSTGCGIYAERPQSCRDFHCMWRVGFGRLMERPDRVGFFLDVTKPGGQLPQMMIARDAWRGALESPTVRAALNKIAEKHVIIIVHGDKRKMIGPPDAIETLRGKVEIVEAKR